MADSVYYDPWSNTKTKSGLDADLVISALQKCIRRGEEELALRMAYELYITSTFHEEKMWNRLLVISRGGYRLRQYRCTDVCQDYE